MSGDFKLNAEIRSDLGKGASRRLRRLENRVLGIVYGGEKEPTPITIAMNEMVKMAENEVFFASLIDLSVAGKTEQVVVKDMQRHPSKETIMHIDFFRVDAATKLTLHVPIHLLNEDTCKGVKLEGGIVARALNDLEVICLPKDLPDFIEVDLAELNVGDNIHLSELKLPEGVESVALSHGEAHDLLVVAINAPRVGGDEDEDEDDAAAEDSAEPAAGDDE